MLHQAGPCRPAAVRGHAAARPASQPGRTFLTDGGEEVRSLTQLVTPEAEHVLDWFHIAMCLRVLEQYARRVAHHDEKEGVHPLRELERTKWLLRHGNHYRARQHADDLRDDVKALQMGYPHRGKFARSAQEFAAYIRSNSGRRRAVPVRGAHLIGDGREHGQRGGQQALCQAPAGAVHLARRPPPAANPHPRSQRHAPALVRAVAPWAWPTTTRPVPVRQPRRERPTLPHGPVRCRHDGADRLQLRVLGHDGLRLAADAWHAFPSRRRSRKAARATR